jgi:hypothetical protein
VSLTNNYFNQAWQYSALNQLTEIDTSTQFNGYPEGVPSPGTATYFFAKYTFSATANNGQITQMQDSRTGSTVSYQYDLLKRVTSAAASGSIALAAWLVVAALAPAPQGRPCPGRDLVRSFLAWAARWDPALRRENLVSCRFRLRQSGDYYVGWCEPGHIASTFDISPRGAVTLDSFFTWFSSLSEASARSLGPRLVPSACPTFSFGQSEVASDQGSEAVSKMFYTEARKASEGLARRYLEREAHSGVTIRYSWASSGDPFYWIGLEVDGRLREVMEYRVEHGTLGALGRGYDREHKNLPPEMTSGLYDRHFWWKTETLERGNNGAR